MTPATTLAIPTLHLACHQGGLATLTLHLACHQSTIGGCLALGQVILDTPPQSTIGGCLALDQVILDTPVYHMRVYIPFVSPQ